MASLAGRQKAEEGHTGLSHFKSGLGFLILIILTGCSLQQPEPSPTPARKLMIQTLPPLPLMTTIPPSLPPSLVPSATATLIPTATSAPPPTEIALAEGFNGQVSAGRGGLRLRSLPSQQSNILYSLSEFAPLTVQGVATDTNWALVETEEGFTGWVWLEYLDLQIDLASLTTITDPEPQYLDIEAPAIAAETEREVSGVTSTARTIFLEGQGRGNRPNIFSKVGDSITVGTFFLYPIGWGDYRLHEYGYLAPTLQYFARARARDSNSFSNSSLAADNGWTTENVLDPAKANPSLCETGETPLECEYRLVRPALALIMFGTNDVSAMSGSTYAANLTRIVQISLDYDVIPVLSTFPYREGFDALVQEFNQIVRQTAQSYDIPLWDYQNAMAGLPNQGLSPDGVHPSYPSETDFAAATDFSAENLQYGYVLRNLMALQVLDQLRKNVLY